MMLLKGNFETIFLASILQVLANDKKTGILRVLNEDTEIKIVFKDGDIIYAIGSSSEARLSKALQTKGIISEKKLKQCFHLAKKKKVPLDQILIDTGMVTADALCKVVHKHVEDIIFNLLLWETGKFEYKDAKINHFECIFATKVNTIHVLLEASRRVDQPSILRKQISNDKLTFKKNDKILDRKEIILNPEEQQILSVIDGTKNICQILKEAGHDEFVVYKCLYSLISTGLIINTADADKADADKMEEKTQKINIRSHISQYSIIITLFLDVIHIIRRSLETEVGRNVFSIFDECKPGESFFKPIFKNFNPENPNASNIHVILQAMGHTENFEEGRMFLINGFNEFLGLILFRTSDILGPKPTMEILEKIDKTLSYVDKYQNDETGKSFLISEIKNMLLKTQNRILYKRGSKKFGGLFSLSKKRKTV